MPEFSSAACFELAMLHLGGFTLGGILDTQNNRVSGHGVDVRLQLQDVSPVPAGLGDAGGGHCAEVFHHVDEPLVAPCVY